MTDAPDIDDFELLDAWGTGDRRAARELLRRHTGALMRFFDRKLDGPVEDAVQDTLLACVEARHRFRREAGFRSYLFGIARNVLFAALRAKHRETGELDPESSRLADLAPSPSRLVEHNAERRVLLESLRRLSLDNQVLLELYHLQRLSGPELADALGLSERAVRSRLHRAMAALRDAFAEVADSSELVASSWADFEGWAQALADPRG